MASPPPGRLLWLCRRGHRELDILLNRFLRHSHATLSGDQLRDFENLLRENDMDILGWLTGRQAPPPGLAAIVQCVANSAETGQAEPGERD